MATTTVSSHAGLNRVVLKPLSTLGTASILTLLGLAITIKLPTATPLAGVVYVALIAVVAWLFFSERYEWSLVVLMFYLGLADGYLKLSTGSSNITLVRDLLFYSIVIGALVRIAIRQKPIKWPPLTGWLVAWALVVMIQLVNPADGTLTHSIGALRPHLEWVPLFFLAYFVMTSKARLRQFLLLLVVIATANGIVGFIQLNLTPEQLSGWGPGYAQAISGEGDVSARTYTDNAGETRTRPFGLGGDFGFGGQIGLIAIPAALALLALVRSPRYRLAMGLLAIGPVLGVLTSEARVAVLSSVVAVLAYAALAVTSRAGLRTVFALCLVLPLAYVGVGLISSNSSQGTFDRYESISSPSKAVSTAIDYRSSTYSKLPTYVAEIPLGGGIGSAGPATSLTGGPTGGRSAESEVAFLVIETGVPGLLVMLGFFLTLLYLSVAKIRKIANREVRILMTAIAAPLFGIFASGFVGTNTATTPSAPYLWFAAGILSLWLLGEGYQALNRAELSGASDLSPFSAPDG